MSVRITHTVGVAFGSRSAGLFAVESRERTDSAPFGSVAQ